MRAKEILDRGVQLVPNRDETFSETGRPDFQEEAPEIFRTRPKGREPRPVKETARSVKQNNSYT